MLPDIFVIDDYYTLDFLITKPEDNNNPWGVPREPGIGPIGLG